MQHVKLPGPSMQFRIKGCYVLAASIKLLVTFPVMEWSTYAKVLETCYILLLRYFITGGILASGLRYLNLS